MTFTVDSATFSETIRSPDWETMKIVRLIVSLAALCTVGAGAAHAATSEVDRFDTEEWRTFQLLPVEEVGSDVKIFRFHGGGLLSLTDRQLHLKAKIAILRGVISINGKSYGPATPNNLMTYVVTKSRKTLYVDDQVRTPDDVYVVCPSTRSRCGR